MQIVQGKDKDEAVAALRKHFKIKKPITITPTGEVRVEGVTDDPKPPRAGAPMPPPPPGVPPPAAPKEPEKGSQIGKEDPNDEAVEESVKKDKLIASKLLPLLDQLDKVQAEWRAKEKEYDAARDAESDAYHALTKEHGVTKYLDLPADVRAEVDKRREPLTAMSAAVDALWKSKADPIVADIDALIQTASDPLYSSKWSNIYQSYGTIGDRSRKIDTDRIRQDLRTLHTRAPSREFYEKVVRGRKEVEVGTLQDGDLFALVKPPYGSDIEAGYYEVAGGTSKRTQLTVRNRETGKEIKVRAKLSVLPLSAAEEKRGRKLHADYKKALGESLDEAKEEHRLPVLDAADRLMKKRERREAMESAALYGRFHRLVNMHPREIKAHLRSPELRETLQVTRRNKVEGIRLGQDAVEHALVLKSTPLDDWTPALWEWCDRIVKFIERTRHNAAPVVDEGGKPTRKTLTLRTWGHDPLRESRFLDEEFHVLHNYEPSLALRMVDASTTRGPVAIVEAVDEDAPDFDVLKANRKKLSDEERAKCMEAKAVWHPGNMDHPIPAVWCSEVGGKTYFVTNTHRAYNVAPTLEGAIGRFHKVIKKTA